jgi:EmrB/QacA subfamily drug resistance transporter
MSPDSSPYPLGKRRTLVVFAGLTLGMLLAALNQTIVSTALPKIVGDLGGLQHYSWVFSAYMLGLTITVPLYGKLSDIYGRRPFFVLGILVFSAGAIVCGLAPSMAVLIAGRAIQGLGAGGLIPLAIAVIGDIVPPRLRGKWQGVTGGVFALSSIAGPAAGGWIADNTSWRWAFFVSLPFAALALVVVWYGFGRRSRLTQHSIDWLGALLLTAGASTGLLAAVWGGVDYPWTSAPIIGLFLACALLVSAFIVCERRAAEPILPPALFRNRTFAAAIAALFPLGAAMFGAIMFIPLFVQRVLGESATSSGAVLTPLMLGWIGASVAAGQIVSRTGRYRPVLLAGPPLIASGFYLLTRLGVSSSTGAVTRDVVIVGLGLGLMVQTFVVVVQNSVPRGMIGVATASTQFFRTIGATVGVTVMGAIVTARISGPAAGQPAQIAHNLHIAFALAIALAGVSFVATLFVPHTELRHTMDEPVPETELARAA